MSGTKSIHPDYLYNDKQYHLINKNDFKCKTHETPEYRNSEELFEHLQESHPKIIGKILDRLVDLHIEPNRNNVIVILDGILKHDTILDLAVIDAVQDFNRNNDIHSRCDSDWWKKQKDDLFQKMKKEREQRV